MEYHRNTKQALHVQDVYKLLYQGNFGVEHFLSDTADVLSFLRKELSSLDTPKAGEALVERISRTNDVVRINLRPFKVLNLDVSALVEVMLHSAAETVPDTLMFYRQWNEFSALVRYGMLDFPVDDLIEYNHWIRDAVFRPVHHSSEYRDANIPAYRVVRRTLFEQRFGNIQ